MSRITIAQLETAETSIQELTVAELNATKGGLLINDVAKVASGIGAGFKDINVTGIGGTVDDSLNSNKVLSGNHISL